MDPLYLYNAFSNWERDITFNATKRDRICKLIGSTAALATLLIVATFSKHRSNISFQAAAYCIMGFGTIIIAATSLFSPTTTHKKTDFFIKSLLIANALACIFVAGFVAKKMHKNYLLSFTAIAPLSIVGLIVGLSPCFIYPYNLCKRKISES